MERINKNLRNLVLKKIIAILLIFSVIFFGFSLNQKAEAISLSDFASKAAESIAICFIVKGVATVLSIGESAVTGGVVTGAGAVASGVNAILSVPVSDLGTQASILTASLANQANIALNKAKIEEGNQKECLLDGGANGIKRLLISSFVKDTVNWINNGFDGNPAFGTSLLHTFEDNKNKAVDELLLSNRYTKGLCKGYDIPLKFALNLQLYGGPYGEFEKRYTPQCTLTSAKESIDDIKDFYDINEFLEITTNPDNNPFSIYFNFSEDLKREVEERTEITERELNQNDGFLSFRKCDAKAWRAEARAQSQSGPPSRRYAYDDTKNYSKYDSSPLAVKYCQIVTPGKAASDVFNKALGAETDELITADEFNEIIQAIVGQLVKKLTGSGGIKNVHSRGRGTDNLDTRIPLGPNDSLVFNDQKNLFIKNIETIQTNFVNIKRIWNDRKIFVNNAKNISNQAKQCWLNKNPNLYRRQNNTFYDSRELIQKSNNYDYEKITSASIGYSRNLFINNESYYDELINQAEDRIEELNEDEIKLEEMKNAIKESGDYNQFVPLAEETTELFFDVGKDAKANAKLLDIINQKINGTPGRYNIQGNPVYLGGVFGSLKYCEQFTIIEDPNRNIPSFRVSDRFKINNSRTETDRLYSTLTTSGF